MLIIGILLTTMGCQIDESKEAASDEVKSVISDAAKYCILTATEEKDGYFNMVDKLFSEGIPCDDNNDCYNFLLEQDDFRSLAPEFYEYLDCEETEESIAPNKVNN